MVENSSMLFWTSDFAYLPYSTLPSRRHDDNSFLRDTFLYHSYSRSHSQWWGSLMLHCHHTVLHPCLLVRDGNTSEGSKVRNYMWKKWIVSSVEGWDTGISRLLALSEQSHYLFVWLNSLLVKFSIYVIPWAWTTQAGVLHFKHRPVLTLKPSTPALHSDNVIELLGGHWVFSESAGLSTGIYSDGCMKYRSI